MSRSRIELIPLFRGLAITTNGTQESRTTLDLNVPEVRNLLPQCEALFVIGITDGIANGNIDWNVAFMPGFDRNHEVATFYDIAAAHFGSTTPTRSADYTTTANFLLEARLQVWWANKPGVSGAKSAILSCVLGARRYGQ